MGLKLLVAGGTPSRQASRPASHTSSVHDAEASQQTAFLLLHHGAAYGRHRLRGRRLHGLLRLLAVLTYAPVARRFALACRLRPLSNAGSSHAAPPREVDGPGRATTPAGAKWLPLQFDPGRPNLTIADIASAADTALGARRTCRRHLRSRPVGANRPTLRPFGRHPLPSPPSKVYPPTPPTNHPPRAH